MGSSILSEVHDASILRTGLSTRYICTLNALPASRLLPPRSGLERSDFVRWPISAPTLAGRRGSFRGYCRREAGRAPHRGEARKGVDRVGRPPTRAPLDRGMGNGDS